MLKILFFVLVIFLIYKLFFAKKSPKSEEDVFVECQGCGGYFESRDIKKVRGKSLCKECLKEL